MCLGLADLITDGIACAGLLRGDIATSNDAYKVAYVTILSFGVVTNAISMALRFRNARLVREHLLEVGQQVRTARVSVARRQARQHGYELAQTHRTKVTLSLSLLSVATQGATLFTAALDERACRGISAPHCRCAHVDRQLLPHLHRQRRPGPTRPGPTSV